MPAGDPFTGEIALFPFLLPPRGWAWCDGQLLPLSQNVALFSLLGTYYGGNGMSTFALPNLNGRAPLQQGQGPGLSDRYLGETGGSDIVTLLEAEMPSHTHVMASSVDSASTANPLTAMPATTELPLYHSSRTATAPLQAVGGSQPHNNMQPYLTLNYAICLQGIFPPRG